MVLEDHDHAINEPGKLEETKATVAKRQNAAGTSGSSSTLSRRGPGALGSNENGTTSAAHCDETEDARDEHPLRDANAIIEWVAALVVDVLAAENAVEEVDDEVREEEAAQHTINSGCRGASFAALLNLKLHGAFSLTFSHLSLFLPM